MVIDATDSTLTNDSEQVSAENFNRDSLWDFDFEGWTIGEDALYMEQLRRCRHSGEVRPLFAHWSRMIRHWPYARDPRSLNSYNDLDPNVYDEIIERIDRGIRFPKREDFRTGGGET